MKYNVSEYRQRLAVFDGDTGFRDRKVIERAFSEDLDARHGGDALMMAYTNRRTVEG
ncbi:MAG: hypothetical protein LBB48_08565 [Treponema sp.]|nr:hypothetical protein [Treponema sp.]